MTTLPINYEWQNCLKLVQNIGSKYSPRDLEVTELLGQQIRFSAIDPLVSIAERKMKWDFPFREASWICSGKNDLEYLTSSVKNYANFSDDGKFLNSAYGPKFVDQLPYIIKCFQKDNFSRQAVINIWREKPGDSKDLACTLSHQYIYRDGKLHLIATMRSQDLMWGFCYDSFTFTCMLNCVRLLCIETGALPEETELGTICINVGSLHIYKPFYEQAQICADSNNIDEKFNRVKESINECFTQKKYSTFINFLHLTSLELK